MHELSLSYSTVELVLESIAGIAVKRVKSVTIVAGQLSGVAVEAFQFSFPIAAEGTLVEGCELKVLEEPVTVYCAACQRTGVLADLHRFRCPDCGEPTGDVRSGKEFLLQSIDVETLEEAAA